MPASALGPHMVINFVLIGFLCGRLSAAVSFFPARARSTPNDGMLFELWAITAVVLGGHQTVGRARHGGLAPWAASIATPAVAQGAWGHIGADSETVNLVIGTILIVVLLLDRQFQPQGRRGVEGLWTKTRYRRCASMAIVKTFPGVRAARRGQLRRHARRGAALMARNGAGQIDADEGAGWASTSPTPAASSSPSARQVLKGPLEAKAQGVMFITPGTGSLVRGTVCR